MNFYEYLGVKQTATREEIHIAFRKLAKQTHPDHNKQDSAFWDMVELNLIRDTLLNPEKRRQYDETLLQGLDYPFSDKSVTEQKQRKPFYKSVRSLFVYRCKVCGHEMHSTWKGYCLYHFLEATGQLYNQDYVFEYGGQLYRWMDPPDELLKDTPQQQYTSVASIKPIHIFLYMGLICIVIAAILLFIRFYLA